MDDNRDFSTLLHTKCDRKVARRTKKKLKAVCRLAHAQHKNVNDFSNYKVIIFLD